MSESKSTTETKRAPTRDKSTIFDNFGYDLTPDIRADSSLTRLMDIAQNRAVLSEFYAMTLFVWVGCGAAVSSQSLYAFDPEDTRDNTFLLGVAVAFGFAIAVLVYTIAPYSGGHINPAVTFAFWLLGDIDWLYAGCYVVAQLLGALLGAALVWGCMNAPVLKEAPDGSTEPPFLLAANFVTPGEPLGSAFLIELMGTFLLVWTVLLTAVSKISIAGNLAPIAIGWSVMLAHLVLIPFTGCGINPARSFGPHMVILMAGEGLTAGWWVYYTAPFVGAGLAALLTKYIFGVRNAKNPVYQETVMGAFASEPFTSEPEEEKKEEEGDPTAEHGKTAVLEEEAKGKE